MRFLGKPARTYAMGMVALLSAMVVLGVAWPSPAHACGGCFHPTESRSTQVTGHRMVLSISQTQTTLWDQFDYAGDPEDFAWVLPINGSATIGLSSEASLAALEQDASVVVSSPPFSCPPCGNATGAVGPGPGAGTATGSGGMPDPVEVVAQEVVGPFETVQLSSTDGSALLDWLQGHGYEVPVEIQPIIDAYVAQSFDFLALKLVPGAGISAMRPVRVTTPGASPVLPLRMVAAGTGAFTSLKLIVLAEGRYEAANAPSVLVDRSQLVWDWDTQSSNYASLRSDAWGAADNTAWLVESSYAINPTSWSTSIVDWAEADPEGSGYGDGDPMLAVQEATEDAAAMFGGLDPSSARLTFMTAELSKAALAQDLVLEASSDQSILETQVQAAAMEGTPPCPSCGSGSGGSGSGGAPATSDDDAGSDGCHYEPPTSPPSWRWAALALLVGLGLRRRSRRSDRT